MAWRLLRVGPANYSGNIHGEGKQGKKKKKKPRGNVAARIQMQRAKNVVTLLHVAHPQAPAGSQASCWPLPKHVLPLSTGPVMHES